MRRYFTAYGVFIAVTALAGGATYWLCSLVGMKGIVGLVIKMLICVVIPNLIYLICFFRKKEFSYFYETVRRMIGRV